MRETVVLSLTLLGWLGLANSKVGTNAPLVDKTDKEKGVAKAKPRLLWQSEGEGGTELTFSPDGKYLLQSKGPSVYAWRIEDQKKLVMVDALHDPKKGVTSQITAVAVSADGKIVAAAFVRSKSAPGETDVGLETPKGIPFVPKGEVKAAPASGVFVWNISDGSEVTRFTLPSVVASMTFGSSSKFLALNSGLRGPRSGDDYGCWVVNVASPPKSPEDHFRIYLTDRKRETKGTLGVRHNGELWRNSCEQILSLSDDGSKLVTVSHDYGGKTSALHVTFDQVETASRKAVKQAEFEGQGRATIQGHLRQMREFRPSRDGRYICCSGGGEETLRFWDLETGKVKTLQCVEKTSVWAISELGGFVAMTHHEGPIRVVRTDTGEMVTRIAERGVQAAISPDGKVLASLVIATKPNKLDIRVWELSGILDKP